MSFSPQPSLSRSLTCVGIRRGRTPAGFGRPPRFPARAIARQLTMAGTGTCDAVDVEMANVSDVL